MIQKFKEGDSVRFSKTAGSNIAKAIGAEIGTVSAVQIVDGVEYAVVKFPVYGSEFPIEAAQLVGIK